MVFVFTCDSSSLCYKRTWDFSLRYHSKGQVTCTYEITSFPLYCPVQFLYYAFRLSVTQGKFGAQVLPLKPVGNISRYSLVKILKGSLKIFKDLTKIFKDEDLRRILEGSLQDPQRFSNIEDSWDTSSRSLRKLSGSCKDLTKIHTQNLGKILKRILQDPQRVTEDLTRILKGSLKGS